MHQPETWGFVQFANQEVGQEKVEFVVSPDQELKWMLRQLYYQQRQYKEKNGKYAHSLYQIKAKAILKKYRKFSRIKKSYLGYEIILKNPQTKTIWCIREDGKIWESTKN